MKIKAPSNVITDSLREALRERYQFMEGLVAAHVMICKTCQTYGVDYKQTLDALDPDADMSGLIDGTITQAMLEAFIKSRLKRGYLRKLDSPALAAQ